MSLTLSQTLEEVENSANVLDCRFDNIDMFVMNLVDDMKKDADRRQVTHVPVKLEQHNTNGIRVAPATDNNVVPEPSFAPETLNRKRPASPPALFDEWDYVDSKVNITYTHNLIRFNINIKV